MIAESAGDLLKYTCYTFLMPQLNCYVPEDVAEKVRAAASREGKPVSRYLAELVRRDVGVGWPEGYFERVLGSWQGKLERPDDPPPQERDGL
jgi:hypothetical protein